MSITPVSLFERLRSRPDDDGWRQLTDIYTPLIRSWLRGQQVADADADDLTQEVLAVVVRELPDFRHNGRPGAFRHWLRAVTANRLRTLWRERRYRPLATGASDFLEKLAQLEDPDSALSRAWDLEHDRHVARRLLESVRAEFEPRTWRAFWRVVVEAARPAAVADELGTTVNAVLLAKSRVLRRLREEGRGLLD
jgi:RNA polymerase sigma-70 factor (ECF subfamily)